VACCNYQTRYYEPGADGQLSGCHASTCCCLIGLMQQDFVVFDGAPFDVVVDCFPVGCVAIRHRLNDCFDGSLPDFVAAVHAVDCCVAKNFCHAVPNFPAGHLHAGKINR